MSTFGIILSILLLILFFLPYKYMVSLLMILCPFMVTSVINAGQKYMQPYVLCEIALIIKSIQTFYKLHLNKNARFAKLIILIIAWGLFITYVGPNLFEGYKVVGKSLDSSFYGHLIPLQFGSNNISQIIYLIINFLTLLFLYINKDKVDNKFILNSFICTITIAVVFGYWEFMAKTINIFFPTDFLFNSGELYTATAYGNFRMSSLCGEASFFGAFISAAFWSIACLENSWYRNVLLVLIAGCIVLNFSGSGYLTFAIGLFIFLIVKGVKVKYIVSFGLFITIVLLILSKTGFLSDIILFINDKQSSDSSDVRMGTTLINWNLFVHSYGLGLGLGSTRSSSFLIDLLTGMGIIGFILMFKIYATLIISKYKKGIFIFIYSVSLMMCQIMSIPDFSYSLFWLGLFVAATWKKETCVPLESSVK